MATKRRHLTEAQKAARKRQRNIKRAYNRQRQRIESVIERESSQYGAGFLKNPLPPIPKKITEASVRRLKKISNISIVQKAYYANPKTGEVIKGYKGRNIQPPAIEKPTVNKPAKAKEARKHEIRQPEVIDRTPIPMHEIDEEYDTDKAETDRYRERFQYEMDKIEKKEKELQEQQKKEDYYEHLKRLQEEGREQRRRMYGDSSPENTPSETDIVLDRILKDLQEWDVNSGWSSELANKKSDQVRTALDIINTSIQKNGRDRVARFCQENADKINKIINDAMYKYDFSKGNFYNSLNSVDLDLVELATMFADLSVDQNADLTDDEMEDYDEVEDE